MRLDIRDGGDVAFCVSGCPDLRRVPLLSAIDTLNKGHRATAVTLLTETGVAKKVTRGAMKIEGKRTRANLVGLRLNKL